MPTKKPLRPSDIVSVSDFVAPLPMPGVEQMKYTVDVKVPNVDVDPRALDWVMKNQRPYPQSAVHRTFDCDFSLTERVRTVPPPADAPMEEQEAYAESPFSIVPIAQLSCGLSMDPLTAMEAARDLRFLEQHLNSIFGQLKQKVLQEFSQYMYATRNGTRGMNPYEFNPYENRNNEQSRSKPNADKSASDSREQSERSGTVPPRIGKGTPT